MTPEYAETVGIKAVAWLVGNDDVRGVFLGASGLSEDDLRAGLADPAFLGSVLEFICQDDAWVVDFADGNQLVYTDPLMARQALPGGQQVHWT